MRRRSTDNENGNRLIYYEFDDESAEDVESDAVGESDTDADGDEIVEPTDDDESVESVESAEKEP